MRRSSLRWTLPTLLALQLGLLWIQGAQLHRQNLLLQDMHEDLQAILERVAPEGDGEATEEGGLAPAHLRRRARTLTRVALREPAVPVRRPVPWQRWAVGSAILGAAGIVALLRLRRRH